MAGFQRDIGGGVDVPQVAQPQNMGSNLGDIATLVETGANIYKYVKEEEAAVLAKQHEEKMSAVALGVAQKKLQYLADNPDATSWQIDNKLNEYIKKQGITSPSDVLAIRERLAKDDLGGSAVSMLLDEERAEKKAYEDAVTAVVKKWSPYASIDEAIANGGEQYINELMVRDHLYESDKLIHEQKMRSLNRRAKSMEVTESAWDMQADHIYGELTTAMYQDVENVIHNYKQQALTDDGKILATPEFNKGLIQELDKGKMRLQLAVNNKLMEIEDQNVRQRVEGKVKDLLEGWDEIVKPTLEYFAGTNEAKFDAEQVTKYMNSAVSTILEDPAVRMPAAFVKLGLLEGDLLQSMTEGLIGEQVRQLMPAMREYLKDSQEPKLDPSGTTPALDPVFNDSTKVRQEDGTLVEKPSPALSAGAKSIENVTKGALNGTMPIPDAGKDVLYANIVAQMKDTIADPERAGAMSPEVTGMITGTILDPAYENMPESYKNQISQQITPYVRTFFGGTKEGTFAPQVMSEWQNVRRQLASLGFIRPDAPYNFALGINDDTGLIQVVIADEDVLSDRQLTFPFGGQVVTPKMKDEKSRRARQILGEFKSAIENDKQVNDMLTANAKAKNIPLYDATSGILAMLQKSSSVPIFGQFIDEPDPVQEKPVAEEDTSKDQAVLQQLQQENQLLKSMSVEEFSEFIKLQAGGQQMPAQQNLQIDEEGNVWIIEEGKEPRLYRAAGSYSF